MATKIGPGQHPLVGAGLHYRGRMRSRTENQAEIIAVIPSNSAAGDLVLIQYFDWTQGEPSTRRLIPLTDLAVSDWVFYGSPDEMDNRYRGDQERELAAPVQPR